MEVVGLCKTFQGFALEDVTFALPRGYVMGLIGANGAGKTTTLKLLSGLLRRTRGEVRVLGLDPAVHETELRRRIGFVHDEPFFYPNLTGAQNASLLGPFYPTWDWETFARLGTAFGVPLGKPFGALSRGNKTRFALLMALSHRAELILMDEPTTGLDPVFRRELLDTLRELLLDERVSILFSTHITADLDTIADYLTLLRAGRVVFSAAKDEILEHWGVVRGGLDILDRAGDSDLLCGVRRGALGFEALSFDAAAARRRFGDAALVERPTLDDVVLLTAPGANDA